MKRQTNRVVLIRRRFLNGWEPSASGTPTDQSGWGKASQGVEGPIETTVHLYLCRDRLDTLGQVLKPHSLVIIGGRRWWPNDASYFARMLRSIGRHVILVSRKTAGNELQRCIQSRAELEEVIRHA
jgi:hypothetical protein